jgi:peptide/nickel transport system permease protein
MLQAVPIVLVVVALVFVLFSVIPGNFASSLQGDGATILDVETVARMNAEFGLSDPVHLRLGRYVAQLVHLDLGMSFRARQPVLTVLLERLWPTSQLVFAAMGLATLIGVPIGFYAALRSGHWGDSVAMIAAVTGLSLPMFWLGLLLMYLVALQLGWLPSFGYGGGALRNLILPAVTLGVAPMALLARTTRAAVLEIMNADFVRTARSKGMSERRVMQWHLARNALVIVLTTLGLQFGSVIGQAVVVEKLFSWPGLGSLLVDSVTLRDIPVVQGAILLIVLLFLTINTTVDVVCALIDPRIKYA